MLGQKGQLGGNTKPQARYSKVVFTLNNYSNEEYNNLLGHLDRDKYIIGKEVGEGGTPHLQGYIEFHNRPRFDNIKKWNSRIHWERAKGSRDENIKYCSKDNNYITNLPVPEILVLPTLDKGWQKELLDIFLTPADYRTINWYWDCCGNTGKSSFVHYCLIEHQEYLCINKGKYNDMINQVYNQAIKNIPIRAVIIDIPKSMRSLSYCALEDIKNGNIINSKYETGSIAINSPHVVVFCNFAPDKTQFSNDRWNINKLCDCEIYEEIDYLEN